jgi:hypothetical protein
MDPNLKAIIEQINQRNGKTLFDSHKVVNIEKILNHLPKLEYIGHGIQSICFKTDKGYVVKCCVKRKNSILCSKNLFVTTTQDLLSINMPILPLTDVLYEDDVWMVYTQPICRMIDDINVKFCYHVIKFVRQMVENNIRISDIYYRNFGIYQNKILLFDYHDIENFDSSSNFLITNIYSLFTLLGKKLGWNVRDVTISHWDEIVSDQFGSTRFPEQLVSLLVAFHNREKEKILLSLDEALTYLKTQLKQKFPTYDMLRTDDNNMIIIDYPNKMYNIIFDLIQNMNLNSVLDVQSTVSGIGLKLAQDFPNILVTLGCGTNDEITDTRNIISNCVLYNASVMYGNIVEFKPTNAERYDLVLYHTVLLDLLQTKKLSDLFQFVRNQVGRYFLLEVPIKGDATLAKIVKNQKKNTAECLLTPYTFRTYLCVNKIKVNRCIHMDYGSRQIKRFLFVCSVE